MNEQTTREFLQSKPVQDFVRTEVGADILGVSRQRFLTVASLQNIRGFDMSGGLGERPQIIWYLPDVKFVEANPAKPNYNT